MDAQYPRTLDLHGLTWIEALPSFLEFYNSAAQLSASKPVGRLEIVHEYGSTGVGGVLGKRLRAFLEQYPDRVQIQLDGNPGHTYVTPLAVLPEIEDMLVEKIIDYCDQPKSQSKIIGKFRINGDPAVLSALRTLEKQGRLSATHNGKVKVFVSV